MIKLWLARRRARRADFATAWLLMHQIQRVGIDADFPATMIALAERCVETAPRPSLRAASEGWRKTYAEGRRVRTGVFPVRFLEPVQRDLADAVEEALKGSTDEP